MAKILQGSAIAASIRQEMKAEVGFYRPRLDVFLVGDNPASKLYVKKKQEACNEVGIKSVVHELDAYISQEKLHEAIEQANKDKEVHGILVQLPLPNQDRYKVFDVIDPKKDVDVFTPVNVGLLVQGRPRFLPCTPHGIQVMLQRSNIPIKGQRIAILSRSDVIGRPLSAMLIHDNDEYANATVTVCHDKTDPEEMKEITRNSDIIVVAVGIPEFLKKDMVSSWKNTTVVDVGTTKIGNKIVGDVDDGVWDVAMAVSPAVGGVGPMTVAMLLKNTLIAARNQ